MAPDLVGQRLHALVLDKLAQPWAVDALAVSCEAIGKHLLIRLDVGAEVIVLRVHLGMKGSWHRYRPGEAWQRTAYGARVELHTAKWIFVCFGPKEVDVVRRNAPRPDVVGHLGPDLLGVAFDMDETLRRSRMLSQRDAAIGDLLLTQTVACGIGNVYKSEVLFLERVHPWTPVYALSDDDLRRLYSRARVLMQKNLEAGGARITTHEPPPGVIPRKDDRYWVYRRAAKPCRTCGTLVRSRLQGAMARRAYWCPTCQPRSSNEKGA